MEDSIFAKIRKKIKNLFRREETAAAAETPEAPAKEETPVPAPESPESVSLEDAAPAEPLESRWTEEYVQFLEETDGGLPQPEREEEGDEGRGPEACEEPEETGSGPETEETDPEYADPEEDPWSEDAGEKKE